MSTRRFCIEPGGGPAASGRRTLEAPELAAGPATCDHQGTLVLRAAALRAAADAVLAF